MAGERLSAARRAPSICSALLGLLLPLLVSGQTYDRLGDSPMYGEFFEPDFPFAEVTLDLRGLAPAGNADNLLPRGLLLRLGEDHFVCFDTELLRVAAVWTGNFITPESIAMYSYPLPLRKMGAGQERLPRPQGELIAHTGLIAGWQSAGPLARDDPRPRWLDPKELGRGPLPREHGSWIGVEDRAGGVVLRYTAFGAEVAEHFRVETLPSGPAVVRSVQVRGLQAPAQVILGSVGTGARAPLVRAVNPAEVQSFTVLYSAGLGVVADSTGVATHDFAAGKPAARWRESTTTEFELGRAQGAYAVDHLRLPYPNPWRRRIRPVDLEFLPDGDAVMLTFDGDVYRLEGMGSPDDGVRWRRIAAGFNEPQSLAVRGGEVFVFSRLGLTRLEDRDGDGVTDFYRMFCNGFAQSADTRDYALSLVARKDGSFVLTKGGQQVDARSPHSGRVLWVSPDGREVQVWATGLRNGYLGIDAERDLLFATDQQGNWVPSSPFHVVRRGSFLGYEPGADGPRPQAQEPALWLPHRIAPSGIEPLWTGDDARLGPLRGLVMYIDYTRPGLTKIFAPGPDGPAQTAGIPLNVEFEVPMLKGAINPADGRPYLVGFQVWDSHAPRLEGLCRLRVLQSDDGQPVAAQVYREGVLLTFAAPLEPEVAQNAANYRVSSWNYRRASSYGSSYYRSDGTPGVDGRPVHAVLLSEDRRSVFVVVACMEPAMQIEVMHNQGSEWRPVYLTAHTLGAASLAGAGFGGVDLAAVLAGPPTPRRETGAVAIVSEGRGLEVATMFGCIACHSTDGSTLGKTGPTWRGLYDATRELEGGGTVRAGPDYLRQAILDPAQTIVRGFANPDAGMPPYRGVLSDEDVESLILYIRSLR